MKNIIYFTGLICIVSFIHSQPGISGRLGMGISSPNYKTFAEGSFPAKGVFETVMLNYSFSYQFYPNARAVYSSWTAFINDTYQGDNFSRSFMYRAFQIETYFFFRKKIELNFNIGPMINKGKISMAATQSISSWDSLMTEFNNSNVTVTASDPMTKIFFGFTSAVGVRYYLKPYLAGEVKIGYMENFYSSSNWSFQDQTIKGPDVNIEDLPLFTFGIIYGW